PMNDSGPGGTGGDGIIYAYHMRSSTKAVKDISGGANFVFCDGHCKFMTIIQSEADKYFLWKADKSKAG
ncbi:MAG: hypothetical protein NT018_13900, partial [Armatimonadetes bacterium]|nr:hypothetical protein [Armatimonadota bacterium]